MKKIVCLLFIFAIASTAFKPGQSAVTRSAIAFQIKNLGINTGGSLGGLKANIEFNPANLAASSIQASVDVNTINTDNSSRDDHLKSDDFFDAARYPSITMRSVSFRHRSGNHFSGQFNLTIKNRSRLIEVPFTYTEKDNARLLKGSFKINRLDFGVGESSMVLSNEVTVSIDAELAR